MVVVALLAAPLCASAQPMKGDPFAPTVCKGNTSDSALLAVYPAAARAAGLDGEVDVACGVSEHGRLKDCRILDERPSGESFGRAALTMLAGSTDNPALHLSSARTAAPVRFTVRFTSKPLAISPNLMGPAHKFEPPRTLAFPSAQEIDHFGYPLRATSHREAGSAMINCGAHVSGSLYDCHVVSETPAGSGFGEHALSLAADYTVTPMKCDGQPVEGGRVLVPVNFEPARPDFLPH
jgi:TonB family protein